MARKIRNAKKPAKRAQRKTTRRAPPASQKRRAVGRRPSRSTPVDRAAGGFTKSGIYPGIPFDVYHLDPCKEPSLSASLIKIIASKSVAHAVTAHPRLNPKYKPAVPTSDMDFGTACHAAVLGTGITIIPAADFRTDRARAARRQLRQAHAAFCLQPDVAVISAMAEKLRADLPDDLKAALFKEPKAMSEVVAIWREDGQWFRARADRWLPPFISAAWPRGLIIDYKTTAQSAAPEDWSKTIFNIGSDFQSALYPHGFCLAWNQSAADGVNVLQALPEFRYIVQETYEPYEFSIMAPSDLTRMHVEQKIVRAFNAWKTADNKPATGYPRRTASFDPPPWELNREDRQALVAEVLSKPL